MASRLLVCLSGAGVSVARWSGRLTATARFDNDEAGLAGFERYLKAGGSAPVHLMVDSTDEDYRFETLPHTSGRDRRELIQRKLRQLYRSTPYFAAVPQPTEKLQKQVKSKRRDDRFLFAALTEADLLTPWINAITARRLPLAGIYPLPVVTAAVAARLKLKTANLLVISKHIAGYRQTFSKDGRFRLTRLTQARGSGERTMDWSFADEIQNTRLYLDALGVTQVDETVDVLILDQDNSLATLRQALESKRGNMQCQRLDREELVLRLKVPDAAIGITPDALHLQLLGAYTPVENLAPSTLLEPYRLFRTRRWLFGATAAVAATGGIWFGIDLQRVQAIEDESRRFSVEAAGFEAQYRDLTRQFPAAPANSATLKLTVDVAARIRENVRTPESLFVAVSDALASSPTVSVISLAWKYGRYPDAATAFAPASITGTTTDRQWRQVGLMIGEITPFSGDYRSAIAGIREFADRLRQSPLVADVRIIKLPLEASSRQSLTGSTSVATEQRQTAQFEIAITYQPQPGLPV